MLLALGEEPSSPIVSKSHEKSDVFVARSVSSSSDKDSQATVSKKLHALHEAQRRSTLRTFVDKLRHKLDSTAASDMNQVLMAAVLKLREKRHPPFHLGLPLFPLLLQMIVSPARGSSSCSKLVLILPQWQLLEF